MKRKLPVILILTLLALSLSAVNLIAQENSEISSRENERIDSINMPLSNTQAIDQRDQDEIRLAELKNNQKETEAKAKEAQRVARDAKEAAHQSMQALKAEKKAQKSRKQADKQMMKAAKAKNKADQNGG
jgi:hypothetical protein